MNRNAALLRVRMWAGVERRKGAERGREEVERESGGGGRRKREERGKCTEKEKRAKRVDQIIGQR